MKLLKFSLPFAFALCCLAAVAQPTQTENPQAVTETGGKPKGDTPRDGAYDREIFLNNRVLPYDHVREADVFWERRVWRLLDVREKMNLPFKYEKEPLIKILLEGAKNGDFTVYSSLDDEFKNPLTIDEVKSLGGRTDTIVTYDENFNEVIQVVSNDLNYADIKRFRIKEVWFFDEETSSMKVRILGIAPIKEEYDKNGNFKFEGPMFWVYYPDVRPKLARFEAFNPENDAARMSWEDIFEMRFFSSYIMKVSNVYDRRIQDYKEGIDILFEAEDLKNEIFHWEHDLWNY